LAGTATLGTDPPIFQVAGDVADFRIGSLLGAPQLFPDPVTGSLSLEGGAGTAYVFDIDLAGEGGRLDLAGFFNPAELPTYEVAGTIAGLDLSGLPFVTGVPPTNLTGTIGAKESTRRRWRAISR